MGQELRQGSNPLLQYPGGALSRRVSPILVLCRLVCLRADRFFFGKLHQYTLKLMLVQLAPERSINAIIIAALQANTDAVAGHVAWRLWPVAHLVSHKKPDTRGGDGEKTTAQNAGAHH